MNESANFDPSVFPYVFECADCGDELRISHEEAEEQADAQTPVRKAVTAARRSKGWWPPDPTDDVRCPDCLAPDMLDDDHGHQTGNLFSSN